MEISKVTKGKKVYLDLLLLADEQESMVDRYLERGELFVLRAGESVIAECVVTKEAPGVYELKNIAVRPDCQRRGYGRRMIHFLMEQYPDCKTWVVGTGDVPSTLGFYQSCGFIESHRVPNFFTEHYDHPIFEDGQQLVDMVYLKRQSAV